MKDDNNHREEASLKSTGDLVLVYDGEEEARNWWVEFKSDVTGEIVHQFHADLQDRVRDALKAVGIIAG